MEPQRASSIALRARQFGLKTVGLFVNATLETILDTSNNCPLDWIQLHGDESPELAEQLMFAGKKVIRAVRIPLGSVLPEVIDAAVKPWQDLGCAILLDADAGGAYGGQGLRLDWNSIRCWADGQLRSAGTRSAGTRSAGTRPRFVLAGGLNCENVRQAIVCSGASGVDVASGVEQTRGQKSLPLVLRWVEEALKGFADLDSVGGASFDA